jgi:hypothetical protein
MANSITKTHPAILRAASTQQTSTGLIWVPPGIQTRFASNSALTTHRNGIVIRRFELQNRSGGVANMGIGFRLANRTWMGGRLSGDGVTYTDLTSTLQSTSGATVQVAGADQTGFAIGCRYPFGWLSATIGTAETNAGGGTVVDHTVCYSQGGSWSAAVSAGTFTDAWTQANAVWAAETKNWVMPPPSDWTVSASLGGVKDGLYWLRFTSADREAGDVAAIVTGLEIGVIRAVEGYADNGVYACDATEYWHEEADGVVAYFSTANAGNTVYVEADTFTG